MSHLAHLECLATDLPWEGTGHALLVMPSSKTLPAQTPAAQLLLAVLKRRGMKPAELAKTPLALDTPQGGRLAVVMVDLSEDRFSQLSVLRKAAQLLLEEHPAEIRLLLHGAELVAGAAGKTARQLARAALYVLWLNGAALPLRKKKALKALQRIVWYGGGQATQLAMIAEALAGGNLLARQLTTLPPNELTPGQYREKIRHLAHAHQWALEEFDMRELRAMGAGAFCAVAQGSAENDAAIVHLRYHPATARPATGKSSRTLKATKQPALKHVALVGKGNCFDTGGHNLKPARYMAGMHEDMNGSAVALGLLQAVQQLGLPVVVDVWLAIAQNSISAQAYKQNDIITTLDGTHVEIVHTDAEGRLVLADTLTLATGGYQPGSPGKGRKSPKAVAAENRLEFHSPDLVIDFATLTGSMISALGNRYGGVFASHSALAELAVAAGQQAAERVCAFPLDEDYETALDSKVADIKQCTLEGDADHILAARFLKRFTHERNWLHLDLSAASCNGGLGAVATDLTGFGVAWGAALLARWAAFE